MKHLRIVGVGLIALLIAVSVMACDQTPAPSGAVQPRAFPTAANATNFNAISAGQADVTTLNATTGNLTTANVAALTASGYVSATNGLRTGSGNFAPALYGAIPLMSIHTLTNTNASGWTKYPFEYASYTLNPSAYGTFNLFSAAEKTLTLDSANTVNLDSFAGWKHFLTTVGTGTTASVDALLGQVTHNATGTLSTSKGIWGSVTNYKTISSFAYGGQQDVTNYGSVATGVGSRVRIANAGSSSLQNDALMTTAHAISADIQNTRALITKTVGITTAIGINYSLTNQGVITTHNSIKLNTPSNTGTIVTHRALQMDDQTVSGATDNYAIYSAGGTSYHAGNIGIGVGATTPQATLDISGTMRLAKYAAQPFACEANKDGAIALTSGYRLCACKGSTTTWVFTSDGTTSCSW
jgi:hypothetical protein